MSEGKWRLAEKPSQRALGVIVKTELYVFGGHRGALLHELDWSTVDEEAARVEVSGQRAGVPPWAG